MAIYTIIRVYRVPGDDQYQATERMAEAIRLHVEDDYHVKDIVRQPEDREGDGKQVELRPARSWFELMKKQFGL